MAASGRISRRLALAIILTAFIPVTVAVVMANSMVRQTSARFYRPEIGDQLNRSLDLYKDLARAVKASMRASASAIAAREPLRRAARDGDTAAVKRDLVAVFPEYPNLVSLTVEDAEGELLAAHDRGSPVDPDKEFKLEVTRPLGEGGELDDEGPQLIAVFATDKARFEERDRVSELVETYETIEKRRSADEKSYLMAFAALLGITIVAAVGVGTLLARGVSTRISVLADATKRVGAGDLDVRVPEQGGDELADLARAFNRMLGEVEASRARIEYLQRIGAWQEMARRLAHEIKNPLTPIQLAVQEVHRRYDGSEERYQKLLDTTLEVVEDEVGTLRRLVSEFSNFARLPQAELEEADLSAYLDELQRLLATPEDSGDDDLPFSEALLLRDSETSVTVDVPDEPAPAHIDRQMLRRALINLIVNAEQAIAGTGRDGHIRVTLARDGDFWNVDVDDDGPGVPKDLRDAIFDPYVTTKTEGTGLGLAIVKKIAVEHGGSVSAHESHLGGARVRLRIPVAGSAASSAALESRGWQGPPSSTRSSEPDERPSETA